MNTRWKDCKARIENVSESKIDGKERVIRMKVTLIQSPSTYDRKMVLMAIWITMGKAKIPSKPISSELLKNILEARHSPIRMLEFTFLFEEIPSNTATHLCRHVHALPYVSSLRNDRQDKINGDLAPRNTPINMIYRVNAEELMIIANKRLCGKASAKTREAAKLMCEAAIEEMPELEEFLVPMCEYHGGVCHEITSCGRCEKVKK